MATELFTTFSWKLCKKADFTAGCQNVLSLLASLYETLKSFLRKFHPVTFFLYIIRVWGFLKPLLRCFWYKPIACDYCRLLCHFSEFKSQADKYCWALGTHGTNVFAKPKYFLIRTTQNLQLLACWGFWENSYTFSSPRKEPAGVHRPPPPPSSIWLNFVKASFNRIKMSHLKDKHFHGAAHMVFMRDF